MTICASCGKENPEGFQFCGFCTAPLTATPAREQRKTVTVVFCDVTGSTALGESTDPEALRSLLARYFERMKAIVEAHGGTVEKFIGDAVMAVFGVPQVHEDDALRACRAAIEMRDALPELGVQARIGANTGEVVTGTEERLATGDAVNVAARLEQAAQPGQILIGAGTLALVRDAVEVEPVKPLELQGKGEPVHAHRLLAVSGQLARRNAAPMVGRERQRRLLDDAFAAVREEPACHLFTMLGAAGVGKSRLVHEFLSGIDARVVRGRCLSYGEGITYWPVAEMLTQLESRPEDAAAAAALRSLMGESDEATTPDEIAWAFRKTLEHAAAAGPVVCVLDDLHWAEPVLLDLVEHVADWTRGAPILLLCIARPELLDGRAGWAGGKLNATTVLLEPLSPAETDVLIDSLAALPDELRTRIRDAAEGNPFFVEEMLAMVWSSGNGDVVVPPTIQALLAARLDQLDATERAVLERGAVEGQVFHRGAVEALAPDEPQVSQHLMSLVRKELVRPERAQLSGDDAFRFRHLLIRDAAYDALPKAVRADLHVRFADWLEEQGADLIELDEILGYHLEQAYRYRAELGEHDATLAERAGERLVTAGRRALWRGDDRSAALLLEEASALVSIESALGLSLRIELGRALAGAGRLERAADVFDELGSRASAAGEGGLALRGELALANLRAQTDPGASMADLVGLAERAIPVFSGEGDHWSLARSWFLVHWARFRTGRCAESIEAAEKMVEHSRSARDAREETRGLGAIAMATLWGPTPVDEGMSRVDELVERARGARLVEAFADRVRGGLLSMSGRFEEGRERCRHAVEIYEELGHPISAIGVAMELQRVERQAGDLDAAERILRDAYERLRALGDVGYVSWMEAQLARILAERGNAEEARRLARHCREHLQHDHAFAQIASRIAEAVARREEEQRDEVEEIGREGLALAEATDMIDLHGDALVALSDLELAAGREDEARARAADAIDLYERKGDVVSAKRTRERLQALGEERTA